MKAPAAERDASGGGAARAVRNGGSAARLGITALTTAAVVLGRSTNLFACPMCFNAEETAMIDGTKLGVVVMLAVLLVVQGAFVAFFLYLRKRARENADFELDMEWSELQRGSRTS